MENNFYLIGVGGQGVIRLGQIIADYGLKKGEKIEKICQLKILNTRREHLSEITKDDCIKEDSL